MLKSCSVGSSVPSNDPPNAEIMPCSSSSTTSQMLNLQEVRQLLFFPGAPFAVQVVPLLELVHHSTLGGEARCNLHDERAMD